MTDLFFMPWQVKKRLGCTLVCAIATPVSSYEPKNMCISWISSKFVLCCYGLDCWGLLKSIHTSPSLSLHFLYRLKHIYTFMSHRPHHSQSPGCTRPMEVFSPSTDRLYTNSWCWRSLYIWHLLHVSREKVPSVALLQRSSFALWKVFFPDPDLGRVPHHSCVILGSK